MAVLPKTRLCLLAAIYAVGATGARTAVAQDNELVTAPAPPAEEAAKPALPYPAGLSMPFRLINIDGALAATARPALTAAAAALAKAWLAKPTSLTQLIGTQRVVTINAKKLADHIATGAPQTGGAGVPLAVEPTWCQVMDRNVFFVTVADARTNTLLASRHFAVPRERWDGLGDSGGQSQLLTQRLPELARAALQDAQARAGRPDTDALHIGLVLAREVTRHDEGSSHCIDMLLEEKLAPDYIVARSLGADQLATMRDLLGQSSTLRRPTRGFLLTWTNPPEPQPSRSLPVKLTLSASVVETVFGHHLPEQHHSAWDLKDGPQDTIAMTVDAGFKALLDQEKATLLLAEWPRVARVHGAWVYLDRGRAWGLKMDDRMIADVGGQAVKGHVVRFFGPEAGLKSARGAPIEEGAILYIRKGQRLPQVGTEFHMDPRPFPTPYPAKSDSKS